jgi:hypothetical protein
MLTAFLPVFFILLLFGGVYFIPKWVQRKKDNRENLINISATVLSKRINKSSKYIASHTGHIMFELSDLRRCELQVPSKIFNGFREGEEGSLQFQGKRFIAWNSAKKD